MPAESDEEESEGSDFSEYDSEDGEEEDEDDEPDPRTAEEIARDQHIEQLLKAEREREAAKLRYRGARNNAPAPAAADPPDNKKRKRPKTPPKKKGSLRIFAAVLAVVSLAWAGYTVVLVQRHAERMRALGQTDALTMAL
jgi:ferric-dicitrate binding protein FerR (iron transport regulator)